MFHTGATIEHRKGVIHAVVAPDVAADARLAGSADYQRLAAERALDRVLEDSFPASDPPSWTLGIAHPQPVQQGTDPGSDTVALDDGSQRTV